MDVLLVISSGESDSEWALAGFVSNTSWVLGKPNLLPLKVRRMGSWGDEWG